MSDLLHDKLAGVRAKHSLVASGNGVARGVVFAIAWIASMMILDRMFELPWELRAILLFAGVGALLWIVTRHGVLPIVKAPDDEELALAVEREEPAFRTRLIAAIQFSRLETMPTGTSRSLVRVMMQETEAIAAQMNFNAVIKTDGLLKTAGVAILVVVMAIMMIAAGGDRTRDLLSRAFLSNIALPTRTKVIDQTNVTMVAQGDDVSIIARADGYVPAAGTVEVRFGKKSLKYALEPQKEHEDVFSTVLGAVQEDFSYRISLYDGRSPWTKVQVKPRPTLKAISCRVSYPAYTGVGVVPRAADDLVMPPGSKLLIDIESSKPLRGLDPAATRLHLFAGEKESRDVLMTVAAGSGTRASAEIDIPETATAISLTLVDSDGLTSKDSVAYRIEMLGDRPPTIHVIEPDRKENYQTRSSTLNIRFEAEDEYMVTKAVLKYQVDPPRIEGEKEYETPIITLPITIAPGKRVSQGIVWNIGKVDIPVNAAGAQATDRLEGCAIEFWLEVSDQFPGKGGPHVTPSEKYLVRVVTEAEKKLELDSKKNESMGTIQRVTEEQEEAARQLGGTITGTQTQPSVPEKP